MTTDLQQYRDDDFCYLTTIGRRTGRPHTIEIWFALHNTTIYMLAGGRDRSDWVKNLMQNPQVQLRLGETTLQGQGRVVSAPIEDALARRLLFEKYTPRDSDDLTSWSQSALPVAIEIGT